MIAGEQRFPAIVTAFGSGDGDRPLPGPACDGCDRPPSTQSGPRAHLSAFRKAAVLDHRDVSKRERSSIVAQRHAVQGAEGIARFERTRRG